MLFWFRSYSLTTEMTVASNNFAFVSFAHVSCIFQRPCPCFVTEKRKQCTLKASYLHICTNCNCLFFHANWATWSVARCAQSEWSQLLDFHRNLVSFKSNCVSCLIGVISLSILRQSCSVLWFWHIKNLHFTMLRNKNRWKSNNTNRITLYFKTLSTFVIYCSFQLRSNITLIYTVPLQFIYSPLLLLTIRLYVLFTLTYCSLLLYFCYQELIDTQLPSLAVSATFKILQRNFN